MRHRLAPGTRAATPLEVARSLVALHATSAATLYLSAVLRMEEPDLGAVDSALYEDRSLVRMLGMRRTVFAVPRETVPAVQWGCAAAIAVQQRRLAAGFLAAAGEADAERWLAWAGERALAILREVGSATTQELCARDPDLRRELVFSPGKRYEGKLNLAGRVLMILAAEGRVVRGRPLGSWVSAQYRWWPVEAWLDGPLPEMSRDAAQRDLVARWLAAYGPGTVEDVRWWTGLGARDVRRALESMGAAEVRLESGPGYVLPGDAEAVAEPEPAAALLPALDPTVMGWIGRDWYLGPHAAPLFDRTGNAGPTVWWGGRAVGAWAQRRDGEIALRILEDVGGEARRAVEAEAGRVAGVLGPTRIQTLFKSDLVAELTA